MRKVFYGLTAIMLCYACGSNERTKSNDSFQLKNDSDSTLTVEGEVITCTMRYTPGFNPSVTVDGYCVKKILFADRTSRPEEKKGTLEKIADQSLGKAVAVVYVPRNNPVGCDLLTELAHPVECSIKDVLEVKTISLGDKTIYPADNK